MGSRQWKACSEEIFPEHLRQLIHHENATKMLPSETSSASLPYLVENDAARRKENSSLFEIQKVLARIFKEKAEAIRI